MMVLLVFATQAARLIVGPLLAAELLASGLSRPDLLAAAGVWRDPGTGRGFEAVALVAQAAWRWRAN